MYHHCTWLWNFLTRAQFLIFHFLLSLRGDVTEILKVVVLGEKVAIVPEGKVVKSSKVVIFSLSFPPSPESEYFSDLWRFDDGDLLAHVRPGVVVLGHDGGDCLEQ